MKKTRPWAIVARMERSEIRGSPASGLSFPGLRCASSGLQAGRDDDGHKKGPGRNRGLMSQTDKLKAYLSRFLSAVPRISPSVAPESEEPYRDGFLLFGNF